MGIKKLYRQNEILNSLCELWLISQRRGEFFTLSSNTKLSHWGKDRPRLTSLKMASRIATPLLSIWKETNIRQRKLMTALLLSDPINIPLSDIIGIVYRYHCLNWNFQVWMHYAVSPYPSTRLADWEFI